MLGMARLHPGSVVEARDSNPEPADRESVRVVFKPTL